MTTEEQESAQITQASSKIFLVPAKLQLPEETPETSSDEMDQDVPGTTKRKRPTEDRAPGILQAVSSAHDPTDEDEGQWERAKTRAQ